MKLSKIQIKPVAIYMVLINIGLTFSLLALDLNKDIRSVIAIISLIQLFVILISMNRYGIEHVSISTIFIVISYIFHFGELILYLLGLDDNIVWDVYKKSLSVESFNKSCIFSMFVITFVALGIMVAYSSKCRNKDIKNTDNHISDAAVLRRVFMIGLFFIVISIIPSVIQNYINISIVLNGGTYHDTYDYNDVLGPFVLLTYFLPVGIFMILIGKQKNYRFNKIFFTIVCIYGLISMLSGNRSLQLMLIITSSYIYFKIVKKPKKTTIAMGIIIGYLGMAVLNGIMQIRDFGLTIEKLFNVIITSIWENPILATIGEFGGTLLSVSLAIYHYPQNVPFKLGLTYIISWISIYPNTGNLLGDFPDEYVYIYDFPNNSYTLGGSYIGELYANFGWMGIVGAIGVGIFIGSVCNNVVYGIEDKKWFKVAEQFILFYYLIFWVRNYFYAFIFTYFWAKVIINILNSWFNKRNKKSIR